VAQPSDVSRQPRTRVAAPEAAALFAELFRSVYLRFHRRDRPRSELPGASRAVLEHLALTGPLTIGEAAQHLQRAQSVVSEIVDGLERKALLARIRDPRDRRRTLVWLTDAGLALLDEDRQVLSRALLEQALARMSGDDRARLIDAVESLLHADDAAATPGTTNRRRTR